MTAPFPKYVAGGIGPKSKPLSFDHINRIGAAVEAMEAADGVPFRRRPVVQRAFAVELLAEEGTIGTRPYWSWRAVGASGSSIAFQTGQLQSTQYDPAQGGYAVSLDGSGAAGDIVIVQELPAFDGKRWFAFGGGSASTGSFALSIDSVGGSDFPYVYSVTENQVDGTGALVATGNSGVLYNLYEFDPYGHGQSLSFATGTLEPGPLEGTVFGGLSMVDGTVRVYICDTPNPMVPACAEAAAVAAAVSGGDARRAADVLRNGL